MHKITYISKKIGCILWGLLSFQCFWGQGEIEKYAFSIKDRDQSYLYSNVLIDQRGALWYVTRNSVYVNYGFHRKRIRLEYNKLNNNTSNPIFQDQQGNIWVGGQHGAYKIDSYSLQYKYVCFPRLSSSNSVISFAQRHASPNIWVSAGNNMLFKIENDSITKQIQIPEKDSIQNAQLLISPKNNLIVDGWSKLYKVENDSLLFLRDKNQANDVLIDIQTSKSYKERVHSYLYCPNKKRKLEYLKEEDLFLISDSEWSLNRSKNTVFHYLKPITKDNHIVFTNFKDKKIIHEKIVERNDSLILIPKKRHSLSKKPLSMAYNGGERIYLGFSGHIEIYRYNKPLYKKHLDNQFAPLSVRGLSETDSGTVFLSAFGGLFKKEAKEKEFSLFLKKDGRGKNYRLAALYQENDSILWGVNDKIHRIHLLKKTEERFDISGFQKFILPKDYKNLWIGGSGLYSFNTKTYQLKPENHIVPGFDLSNATVWSMVKQRDSILLGTSQGLFILGKNGQLLSHYHNNGLHKIRHSDVFDIVVDSNKNIWLGGNKGLSCITPKGRIYHYEENDGLVNNMVAGILEADTGLWISTFGGLSKIGKEDPLDSVTFHNFLKGYDFNYKSKLKSGSSTLFFGSVDGLFEIDAKHIRKKGKHVSIYPISFTAFNQENEKVQEQMVKNHKEFTLELPYDANFFEIKFALSDSFDPSKNDFQYQIDGLTNGWVDIDGQAIVRQFGIPPGNYLLSIKGKNDQGIPSHNQIQVKIHVSQIFYKTFWFRFGLFLSFLSIALLIYFSREKRKSERDGLKEEIQELRINALKTQMSPHFIHNALNGIQSDMALRNIREVNNYIVSFSKLLRANMNMMVKSQIPIEEEVAYLKSYIDLQRQRYNDKFSYDILFSCKKEENRTQTIPCMILQPLVENAIIHGLIPKTDDNRNLRISVEVIDTINVSIHDNGVGRSHELAEPKKGHSMDSVNNRINLINELRRKRISYTITDLKTNGIACGTRIDLEFPLNKRK